MSILKSLFNLIKKAVAKIAEVLNGHDPVDVMKDAATVATASVTLGLTAYAGINKLRACFMHGKKRPVKKANDANVPEVNIETGSIEGDLALIKQRNENIFKDNYETVEKEDMEILDAISKERGIEFEMLPPEQRMYILKAEDFDFEEYKENYYKSKKKLNILASLGTTPDNEPFRVERDFGMWNFILRPLDRFMHWWKMDPAPKKVKQIHLVDHPEFPNVECSYEDSVKVARMMRPFMDKIHRRNKNKDYELLTRKEIERQTIVLEEMGKHKSLKEEDKAIRRRMMESRYNKPSIYELMTDKDVKALKKDGTFKPDKDEKKKSKPKNKDSYKATTYKDKKTGEHMRKLTKEEKKSLNDAEKNARKAYEYYLNMANAGKIDYKGCF